MSQQRVSMIECAFGGQRKTSLGCGLQRSGRGFTLIEILVVLVIIGVMAAMATLSINVLGRDNETEEEARRLWQILRQAREEAELQGLNIGTYFTDEEYEFLRLDLLTNQWLPISGDKLYATRRLPEGLRHRIWLDGREIVMKQQLPDRGATEEDDEEMSEAEQEEASLPPALRTIDRNKAQRAQEEFPPQIVVLSNGELMPFELQIEREREPALWRVVATPENDLRIEQRRNSSEDWQIVLQTNPPLDEVQANARN